MCITYLNIVKKTTKRKKQRVSNLIGKGLSCRESRFRFETGLTRCKRFGMSSFNRLKLDIYI